MPRKSRKTAEQLAAELLERKRRDFAAVNLSPEAAELIRNADIEVTRKAEKRKDGKTTEDNSARRFDAFDALRPTMRKAEFSGCYDAARRLERDMLTRRGEGDQGRKLERVDSDAGRDRTDLIVQAGLNCDYVASRLSRRDWRLLSELIIPSREHESWRAAVFWVTGEANEMAQGSCVRSACVNLRDAYEDLERARQRRAA